MTTETEVTGTEPQSVPENAPPAEAGNGAERAPKAKKAKAKSPKADKAAPGKLLWVNSGNKAELAKLIMPKDENDVLWDPKLTRPVPPGMVEWLAERGWDEAAALRVITGDKGTFRVAQGRTKMRCIEAANKLRAKNKLPPLRIPVVVKSEDDFTAAEMSLGFDAVVQDISPILWSEKFQRELAKGRSEADIAKGTRFTSKQVLELVSLQELSPETQKLIESGRVSLPAALELVTLQRSTGSVDALAAKLAAGGKVSAAQVKEASGKKGTLRPSPKAIAALIAVVKKTDFPGGARGEAVKAAAIEALEVGLDTRKSEKFVAELTKIAKG